MKEKLLNDVTLRLSDYFSHEELNLIKNELSIVLINYTISKESTELEVYNYDTPPAVKAFLVCKMVEGIAQSSLNQYKLVLDDFFRIFRKPLKNITSNDIRVYLYNYQKEHKIQNSTLNYKRGILNEFFEWACNDKYVSSNPVRQIATIKCEQKEREPLTQMELELLRQACSNSRETAVLEMFYSTGCRVSELSHMDITDINFETKEVKIFGKGNKHRTSYLNAKAEVALKTYLKTRTDVNPALIVSERTPFNRMGKDGLEDMIAKISQRTTIKKKVTPHVLRHTTATIALENGMELSEISELLGHSDISTTLIYAKTSKAKVKASHTRCVI